MEPTAKRSDSISMFIAATPAQVIAAMSDLEYVARWGARRLHEHHPPIRFPAR